jgi:guanylate kinase
MRANKDEFLEHARVFDHYYGTPKGPVEDTLSRGRDVLFDIDWQGTQQIKEKAPSDLVRVFILPPSTIELEQRLRRRAQDSEEVVERRMSEASSEMSHWQEYEYVIINRDIEHSVDQVRAILSAERLRRERQLGLGGFVKALREQC